MAKNQRRIWGLLLGTLLLLAIWFNYDYRSEKINESSRARSPRIQGTPIPTDTLHSITYGTISSDLDSWIFEKLRISFMLYLEGGDQP